MAIITCRKGEKQQLSEHFNSSEFDCKGKGCCDSTQVDPALLELLEKIRGHFGCPVRINSGYRCKAHNTKIGGSKTSYHMRGMAADIRVPGLAPREVAAYAEALKIPGIGLYETDEDGHFVHIDVRPKRTRWYGQKQEKRTSFAIGEGEYELQMRTLIRGCKGDNVAALQMLLMGRGYDCGSKGADGIFGKNTEKAVRQYQADCELTEDGIAGRKTMTCLLGVGGHE